MLDREAWAQFEEERLAPYAVKSGQTRGRQHPDVEHPYRSPFQRDRDRIIHTTAFRRLEYKTQVFINYEGDYYRTRLTHTLEATQIARTIARALRLNEDLAEATTLVHDLGHTPFGHAGEATLHKLMSDHGGFNHTEQTLRIVQDLECRYPRFRGLNLTWEVREGIVKHETEYDAADASGFEPELRPSLEAQVVNVSDEIAYNTHDLDDGLRSGLIGPDDLEEEGIILWKEATAQIPEPFSEMTRHRIIRYLINREVTDLIQHTEEQLQRAGIASVQDVREYPTLLVRPSPEMQERNQNLKSFLYRRLYRHYRVVRMAVKAERFLSELFGAYIAEPEQLPTETQYRLDETNLYRVVCDYIAGMTDRYALQEYRRLFDPWQRP
ncbi:MAG: deoxyguanosinetriphosphate triphosphohydrolase [Chloroflexi bacterium]|nr:deoxyguanosinetriphosphate triphosphohydrolase [Chloroflexota bacterium]